MSRGNLGSDVWFTPPDLCAEIAHLAGAFAPAGCRLVEPCAGDGRVAALLPGCEAFDVEPRSSAVRRQDALQWRGDASYFIATNTPFSLAKRLLRHWAGDPMWQGAVAIMPAIAWRWSDQVAGARLVLDGYADALYESPETGKSKLIKAQLQVWLPGELALLPAPRRFVRFQRIGEAPEAGAIGLRVAGSCMRRPAQLLRPAVPALAPGRVYSTVRNLVEVVPGALREMIACDKIILEARSTAQDYLTEDGLNSYIERNCAP